MKRYKKMVLVFTFCMTTVFTMAQQTDREVAAIKGFRTGGLHFFTGPDTAKLVEGDKVPHFAMADTNSKLVDLNDYLGKYVLLDIWASWCTWCIKEYPYVKQLKEEFKNNKIAFISVSCDEMVPSWKSAIGGYHMQDATHWIITDHAFMKAFAVNKIPRFILIDPKGCVYNLDMMRPSNNEISNYLKFLKGI